MTSGRSSVRLGLTIASCAFGASWHCWAQTSSPTNVGNERARPTQLQSALVQPPRLLNKTQLHYPQRAILAKKFEVVHVEAILVIDESGAVVSVSIPTPVEDEFETEVTQAASGLRFEPARRDGTAIKSKIRFRFEFTPPAPTLEGSVIDATTGSPIAGVLVRTHAADTRQQARTGSSGTFDLGEIAPGPTTILISAQGYSTQTFAVTLDYAERTKIEVRLDRDTSSVGPPPSTVPPPIEVTVEGQRTPPTVKRLTRSEIRQTPGAFGDPFRAIETLPGITPIATGIPYFYVRGAPPANVGYFVDDVRVPYLYHLVVGPSVIHPGMVERIDVHSGPYPPSLGRFAGAVVVAGTEAPSAETRAEGQLRLFDVGGLVRSGFVAGKGTVTLGGRYSYTAGLLSLLVPDLRLDYRDYQMLVTYELDSRSRVTLFGLGAYDYVSSTEAGVEQVLFGTEFYRLKLGFERQLRKGKLSLSVTPGLDRTLLQSVGRTQSGSVSIRTDFEHKFSAQSSVRVGGDFHSEAYRLSMSPYLDPASPEQATFRKQYPSRLDSVSGIHAEWTWSAIPELEISPGVRMDLFRVGEHSAIGVDPRLSARYRLSDRIQLVQALGVAHQPPAFTIPIAAMAPADGGLQTSVQTSGGLVLAFAPATSASGSVFYNEAFNLSDGLGTNNQGHPDELALSRARGTSYGLEVNLKHGLGRRLGGQLSYTLSRSTRTIGNERFVSAFDRTHVVNATFGLDLGRTWHFGTRATYYTGAPKSNRVGPGVLPVPRTLSPERNTPFFRLDLRIEKRWNYGERRYLAFVAEIMNATLSREVFGGEQFGPVTIPSIGLEGGL